MFFSHTTPKISKKRRYPLSETEDLCMYQDPDTNPMLKKTKLFSPYSSNAKMGGLNVQNNYSFEGEYKSEPTYTFHSHFSNLNINNWNNMENYEIKETENAPVEIEMKIEEEKREHKDDDKK